MKKGCIIYNTEKNLAKEIYENSLKYFKDKGVEILPLSENMKADFVVVIGGDGTLLRGFKKFFTNDNISVIAVNAGNLGFLTEIKHGREFEIYDDFLSDNYKSEERYILQAKYNDKIYYALNEIVISKSGTTAKLIRTKFFSNGNYMCTYKSDGVIVSTPTGSTAYSMAAGGPIVKSNLKAIIVTPLAPHNLNTRPIVIGGDEILDVSIEDQEREGHIMIDGQVSSIITSKDIIQIKYSSKKLKLIMPKDRDYYSVLREKLKWGDNLC